LTALLLYCVWACIAFAVCLFILHLFLEAYRGWGD